MSAKRMHGVGAIRVRVRCSMSSIAFAFLYRESQASNPMKEIRIQKLIVNCCVGESGE